MKRIVLTVLLIVTVFAAVGCSCGNKKQAAVTQQAVTTVTEIYPQQAVITQSVIMPLEIISITSSGIHLVIKLRTTPGTSCNIEGTSVFPMNSISDSEGYAEIKTDLNGMSKNYDIYAVIYDSGKTKPIVTVKTNISDILN